MTVPETTLARMAAVVGALEGCGIPYALGGALAFGIHAEPRATFDVDVNVFLPSADARRVIDCLETVGVAWGITRSVEEAVIAGQAQLNLGGTHIDLFFADYAFFDSCARRAVPATVGTTHTRVLSAEDIVVCKVLFDRGKDWLDIRQVLLTQGARFDAGYVRRWLTEILGQGDAVLARFNEEADRARRDLPG